MNIGVIFGGKSVEHDISVLTAMEAISHLKLSYNIFPIYIDRQNVWYMSSEYTNLKVFTDDKYKFSKKFRCTVFSGDNGLYIIKGNKIKKAVDLDCIVNACHGGDGECGAVHGLADMAGIAMTDCGLFAASLGMNKHFFKQAITSMGLSTLPHLYVNSMNFDMSLIEFPVIVKPVSLGSSIGISKAENAESMKFAISAALRYDSGAIIEPFLSGFTEINCAAIRYGGKILVSECEQPITDGDYLSFSDKYLDGEKFTGQANAERIFPAKLPSGLKEEIFSATERMYEGLQLDGVVRFDYIIKDGEVLVNEMNTVPGSFANYLFDIDYSQLLDYMIQAAVDRNRRKKQLIASFDSSVLTGAKNACKKPQKMVK